MVSVIIPCYKQAHWLPDAIESVLNQTYKDVEIIVVDDGSPDNVKDVAKKYPVTYIYKKNGGLSSARNCGIRESKGEWILTLDSDDKIDPTFIEKLIGKNDIVSCDIKEFGDSSGTWELPNINPMPWQQLQSNQLHCCSLYKREIWYKVAGYDENMKIGYEDWDFWNRAMLEGYKATVIREKLFYYRKHGNSMVTEATKRHHEIKEYMDKKYQNHYGVEILKFLKP